jgi:hypothetical protein
VNVAEVAGAAERSRLCDSILRALPEWFGIENAIDDYVREVAKLPTLAIGDGAFLALKIHNEFSAEIYVMGVRRGCKGVASAEHSLLRPRTAYARTGSSSSR